MAFWAAFSNGLFQDLVWSGNERCLQLEAAHYQVRQRPTTLSTLSPCQLERKHTWYIWNTILCSLPKQLCLSIKVHTHISCPLLLHAISALEQGLMMLCCKFDNHMATPLTGDIWDMIDMQVPTSSCSERNGSWISWGLWRGPSWSRDLKPPASSLSSTHTFPARNIRLLALAAAAIWQRYLRLGPGSRYEQPQSWILTEQSLDFDEQPYIHPASRGVAAHTAGLFRSVRGAKGGFPPCGLPKLRIFTFPPRGGSPS